MGSTNVKWAIGYAIPIMELCFLYFPLPENIIFLLGLSHNSSDFISTIWIIADAFALTIAYGP